ncbi:MAG: ATPase, T2SS/T4P/T4SS family [Gammaproteobacteria bacterium]|nr:ATPase, T2SS/T4P/T4SS family [Gammaproteobacteria bacterium]
MPSISLSQQENFSIRLANYFVNHGFLSRSIANEILSQANQHNTSLITWIATKKILPGKILAEACSTLLELPIHSLASMKILPHLVGLLPLQFMQQFKIIPLNQINKTLEIGIVDPTDHSILDAVTFQTHLNVLVNIIAYDELEKCLEQNDISKNQNNEKLIQQIHTTSELYYDHDDHLLDHDEPLIQFVNDIIIRAQRNNISDIHIEPYEKCCRIRYRQHGVLQTVNEIPVRLAARMTTRLKILAKLDISERRLPQDGHFRFQQTDIRINICPVLHGEKTVLRLLNASHKSLLITEIGMDAIQQRQFEEAISQPQGLILVTGPTGSGKTVTLYAALHYLNSTEKNISTIEDPVEIHLPGINQTNIHPRIGLSFAKILRGLLRQDPDIIMLGEIRDSETAEIAMQAAQTGHLVLSTLHTNNTFETIMRLQSMGISVRCLAHATRLIIAQRLIRTLCLQCRQIDDAVPTYFSQFNFADFPRYRAVGCHACNAGYTGRTALYEILPLTPELRTHIQDNAPQKIIIEAAKKLGYLPLLDAGIQKIQHGMTTFSELKRVLEI